MISPAWCRMMAAYNAGMNRRLYAAAGQLPDAARRQDRGAWFGSIHGTLCHLVWGEAAH
ncbi:MAG: damage-inducible protein DinB, partial [Acetobacteraceae bacterium]